MQFSLPVPAAGQIKRLDPLPPGGDSLALAQLATQLKQQSKSAKTPLVILTSSAFEAQRLLEEMPWFSPGLSANMLPDW